MEVFPTLSVHPTSVTMSIEDATIRSSFEAGFELTRTKFTRDRHTFEVTYNDLQRGDKDLLLTFLKTVRGSYMFTWANHDEEIAGTDPVEYVTYTVRFSRYPDIPAVGGKYGRYDLTFEVKEV